MLFSSSFFIFFFLPITLLIYAATPGIRLKNTILLVASVLFYWLGEKIYIAILFISILQNYAFGILISRHVNARPRLTILVVGIVSNLTILAYYKYFEFFTTTAGLSSELLTKIAPHHLPLGISFFTFQAIAYLVDIHRRDVVPQRNLIDYALFKAFFPQLIAGPIVRYQTVSRQLKRRRMTFVSFAAGAELFSIGLAKKVLVANSVAGPADQVFAQPPHDLTAPVAWLGIICYTLQIYFDFSGYTDMAIGLGRMFGFRLPKNFNYPYVAQSIQDFWRRWHITLSTWFRYYLYIPLGGNRNGVVRTQINLILVFLLCGLWHGASWNFVVWGAYHGFFLSLERTRFGRFLKFLPTNARIVYALLVVMIGWVFFRAADLEHAFAYIRAMMDIGTPTFVEPNKSFFAFASSETFFWIFVGFVCATRVPATFARIGHRGLARWATPAADFVRAFLVLGGLTLCSSYLLSGTYNPFIYFRF
uniref:Probable alginate O-acetylase AlgI n=1 Tax=Rhodopseudomonas palustris (strain BisA53) TaxID=316055 RepID=Q07IQ0_RHOP5